MLLCRFITVPVAGLPVANANELSLISAARLAASAGADEANNEPRATSRNTCTDAKTMSSFYFGFEEKPLAEIYSQKEKREKCMLVSLLRDAQTLQGAQRLQAIAYIIQPSEV